MGKIQTDKAVTRRGIFLGALVGIPAAALIALFAAEPSRAGGQGGGNDDDDDDDD